MNAFTANSLDITLNKNGDATATFRFTLEGLIENAIPQSLLEEELKKGLTTSSEPPALLSMDRSSASLLLKNFADTSDVPKGTEYRTATMNFKKAEIALQSSALSSVISADFSPSKIIITFPDGYSRQLDNLDVLPSITHTVVDPAKATASGAQQNTGTLKIVSSPSAVQVYLDGTYIGNAPSQFPDIAAGSHTLLFEKDGFAPVTKTVTVKQGEHLQVSVVLVYATPPPGATTPASPGFDVGTAGLAILICISAGFAGYLRKNK
ncbi:PEGA domain-containing protein [uncultured Methanoregula sp.]|uniref:PEGA domain-containing protein n=1 Tax=uncultured Methanoregula sp. TaxID=1005933 RepID=UPI002AAB55AE|nr:PEGA domain-containing protein [uncultured Methanoregula sp.]